MANKAFWLAFVYWNLAGNSIEQTQGITIPFFGTFMSSSSPSAGTQEQKPARTINTNVGGAPPAAFARGNGGPSWMPSARDNLMRDQMVLLHHDPYLNGGYLTEYDSMQIPASTVNLNNYLRGPPNQGPKVARKSKQQSPVTKGVDVVDTPSKSPPAFKSEGSEKVPNELPAQLNFGMPAGFYEIPGPIIFRETSHDPNGEELSGVYQHLADPKYVPVNELFNGQQFVPLGSRAASQVLPPEAVIQFLKSPEQELNPLTRPQIKLPFPLSHDCSTGSGSKPLQFVVLPIVEPVAPLKPLIPKPSFLSSQYGQFPYIPPFNLFKQPITTQSNAVDNAPSGGGSGHFVPILNRPAPPLPFVFVQSLPLELIGQNVEMDVIHSPLPSAPQESTVKEPSDGDIPQTQIFQNFPNHNGLNGLHQLPLIVIEKVPIPTPGSTVSAPPTPISLPGAMSPAAAVEITMQSIQKNSESPPLSSISLVKPIAGTQESHEMTKTIQKLMPVAAAVLENVEQQQTQKEQPREVVVTHNVSPVDVPPTQPTPTVNPKDQNLKTDVVKVPPVVVEPVVVDKEKTPLRPSLRPESSQPKAATHKKPDSTASDEVDVSSPVLSGLEVTDAA